MPPEKTVGKPCAGNPQARFERGAQMVEWLPSRNLFII
jgi:hypothetical protein